MKGNMTVTLALTLACFSTVSPVRGLGQASDAIHGMKAMPSLLSSAGNAGPPSTSARNYTVINGAYVPPNVVLIDRYGRKVNLLTVLAQPRPVLLQFIFTTCTTICPILSATFSQAQNDLSRVTGDYEMISISIDPEYDRPERLETYAQRYHPRANWMFLTGKKDDVLKVVKAFDALYSSENKMYHRPYTFLRGRHGPAWVKLAGSPSVSELLSEYSHALHTTAETGKSPRD